jgi:hypothetical protein
MSHSAVLLEIIKTYASPKELSWIEAKATGNVQSLQTAFVATPRFVSKTIVHSTKKRHEININHWTLDRIVRVYLLTTLDSSDKYIYTKTLDTLFDTAENNEAVALLSALPFFAFPEHWLLRATDAVRSNIGLIFDAIAFQNRYPLQYFSELAWNQLVLKCIFNEKPIHQIEGLNERANQKLAHSVSDFAHERWAAGRNVPPQVWRLVGKFMNETIFEDICTLFASQNPSDQIAAALVCSETEAPYAKEKLRNYPELNNRILSWQMLEN